MEKLHLYKGVSSFEYYCFTKFHDTTGICFNNREIIKLNMWTHIFFNPNLKIQWSQEHSCPVVPADKAVEYNVEQHKRYFQSWRLDFLTGEKYPLTEIDTVTHNGAPGRRYDWRSYHPGYFADPYMWDVNLAMLESYPDKQNLVWAKIPCVNAPLNLVFLEKLVSCLQRLRDFCNQGFMNCMTPWWYERTYDCSDFGLNHEEYQFRLKKFIGLVWEKISGYRNLGSLDLVARSQDKLQTIIERRENCQLIQN